MAMTPMMVQYLEVKEKYKDAVLFYRLGDFYEMFYDDAKLVSRELELTLTGKDCGMEERAPMCGVPYHSAETYIGRLVGKGYKVVVCEQMEDPALAKGLVKRDVVRIVTPGTVIGSDFLNEKQNNYMCSVCVGEGEVGVGFADFSTGDVSAVRFYGDDCTERLMSEIAAYSPREVIMNISKEQDRELCRFLNSRQNTVVNDNEAKRFEYQDAAYLVNKAFGDKIDAAVLDETVLVCAIGALVGYITEMQKTDTSYIKSINIYSSGQYLEIDANTRRNLELCETMREHAKRGSLLWVLDKTRTSMGARLLRKWVEMPLVNIKAIVRRQDAIAELFGDYLLREELAVLLTGVLDIERIMAKVVYGSASPKDLRALHATVRLVPGIKKLLTEHGVKSEELSGMLEETDELCDIAELIDSAIVDDPPFSVREGGIIRAGYNGDVDRLNSILHGGKDLKNEIERREREATGIKNLKIGYNKVFGYYIEITKANKGDLPDYYERKQTLVNCERYITPELKEMEVTVLSAGDKCNSLEYELFCNVTAAIAAQSSRIQATARGIALIDVYLSLADAAFENKYVRPYIEYNDVIKIKDGRHPVVELFCRDSYFIPNDTVLDTDKNKLLLITGPNMAGKSTYMRQVALISVMAQMGSFVPAADAEIGVVDKIFTRVGASDDLASGQSTFMLEMTELAYILKNATKKSLVIFDEIGRGTSTYDGMSIAMAVVEYMVGKKLSAKTLFATHYHELNELESRHSGIVNYNIAAKKKGDEIIFLRKIVRGAADDSYGIEVALLAGVPKEVIKRAKEVLCETLSGTAKKDNAERHEVNSANVTFGDIAALELKERLREINIETLTPIEALNKLYELKKLTE